MSPKYKLTYFDLPGVAEHIRYIFAYANQEFEDKRITFEVWPEFKPKTSFGKLPILEVDGKEVNQSNAIARYLANHFGLTGKDEWEAAQVDALVDTFGDWKSLVLKRYDGEKDEEKLSEIKKGEEFYLEKFDKIVLSNPSGYLVGSQVTWGDLLFASALSDGERYYPGLLKPYPGLAKHAQTINNIPNIKVYLERRPKH